VVKGAVLKRVRNRSCSVLGAVAKMIRFGSTASASSLLDSHSLRSGLDMYLICHEHCSSDPSSGLLLGSV